MAKPEPPPCPEGRKHCPKCRGHGHVKDKAWTGAGVRNKGQRGEREVVKLLQTIVDKVTTLYGREPIVLQRNALQAHLGGEDIYGLEGFSVEVKLCENEQLNKWWDQAVRQAQARAAVPVLLYRASMQPWKVRLRAYVSTPGDMDQHEIDMNISLDSFLAWFEDAFSERYRTPVAERLERESPSPPAVTDSIGCTCVSHPTAHCKLCHS